MNSMMPGDFDLWP